VHCARRSGDKLGPPRPKPALLSCRHVVSECARIGANIACLHDLVAGRPLLCYLALDLHKVEGPASGMIRRESSRGEFNMKNQILVVAAAFAAAASAAISVQSTAFADNSVILADVPITEFHVVSTDIYRGARPGRAGLEALARLHVRTDLNLENDMDEVAAEGKNASELGIRMVSMPMSGFWSPNDSEVTQILSILSNSANYPIYVHCLHGQDRTGLIVGLFRVFYEHTAPADAYREMLDIGFHPSLFLLNRYFEKKTGFDD
jgi:tyrosine-protein phosphatase SIW14